MIKLIQKSNSKPPVLDARCWNCRHYIRPGERMLDGQATSVCTIDRDRSVYGTEGEAAPRREYGEPSKSL